MLILGGQTPLFRTPSMVLMSFLLEIRVNHAVYEVKSRIYWKKPCARERIRFSQESGLTVCV